jgi:hypothetical protein
MTVVLFCLKVATAQVTIPFFKPGAIRVLILSGRNNHDWRTTTPFLRKSLVHSGRFDVRVEEEPMGITQATLAAYHVLATAFDDPANGGTGKDEPMIWTVNYDLSNEITESGKTHLRDFVESGKGILVLHLILPNSPLSPRGQRGRG